MLAFLMAAAGRVGQHRPMVDPYDRIQDHLGIALQKLATFETRSTDAHDGRDKARCVAALRGVAEQLSQAFDALRVERRRLSVALKSAAATMRRERDLFAQSPDPCLVLTRDGAAIADANAAASRLLNMSQRHLIGKPFTNFLQQDRDVFLRQIKHGTVAPGEAWHVVLRPRERAWLRVQVQPLLDSAKNNAETAAILLTRQSA